MFNQLRKIGYDKSGQSTVLVAIAMVVLLGFAAFAVDIGLVAHQKSVLQNAADSAALAGAQDLPTAGTAKTTAKNYAVKNGVEFAKTTATTPYNNNNKLIEVVCSDTVTYGFARVLGFADTVVYARAVAENDSGWDGEVLPFLNANNTFLTPGTKIEAWEKVDSGYFECIENFDIMNNFSPYDQLYFKVDLDKGMQIKNGTVANKKQEIGYYYNQDHDFVYILSLSPASLASGKVILQDGSIELISKLKNKKSFVSLESLVLVKCTFDSYGNKGKTLYLTSVASYDYDTVNNEYPVEDYVNPDGGSSKLID